MYFNGESFALSPVLLGSPTYPASNFAIQNPGISLSHPPFAYPFSLSFVNAGCTIYTFPSSSSFTSLALFIVILSLSTPFAVVGAGLSVVPFKNTISIVPLAPSTPFVNLYANLGIHTQ